MNEWIHVNLNFSLMGLYKAWLIQKYRIILLKILNVFFFIREKIVAP